MRLLVLGVALAACGSNDNPGPATIQCDLPSDPADPCSLAQRMLMPLDHGASGSPAFSYAYRDFPSDKPQATTVIVMNGGPGATLLDTSPNELHPDGTQNFPLGAVTTRDFRVVYTDHRGSGCNQCAAGALPDRVLTTENIAGDILTLIERLSLTDYILYGSSFGTVESTFIAAKAVERGLALPKALVLEGILGKSLTGGFDEYMSNYDHEWALVQPSLPSEVLVQLQMTTLPLGFSAHTWGTFLQGNILLGRIPPADYPLVPYLAPLASHDPQGVATLRALLEATDQLFSDPDERRKLLPRVGDVFFCQELMGEARFSALRAGRLVADGPDRCADIAHEWRPYDSRRFSIPAPIYYLEGADDPATPPWTARYHYDGQKQAQRTFIMVPGAGHAPMTLGLRTLGCSGALWRAIDQHDAAALAAAVASCGPGLSVESKAPGE
jgi:pimeloyl-ACP methyl ester carboxylesterase